MPVPPWIQIILNLLTENIDRCVGCLADLHDECETAFTDKRLLDNSDLLSCNCKPRILQQDFYAEETEEEKLQKVISKLIQQMVCDLSLLPYEFVVLGNSFQKVLDSKGIKTPHNCAGLKLLATSLRIHINNIYVATENILFLKLANCIYHLFTSLDSDIISGVLKTASDFMKNNRNWLNEQIKIICEHFEKRDTTQKSELINHNISFYEEVKIKMLSRDNGALHLEQLYNLAFHNKKWIAGEVERGATYSNSTPAPPSDDSKSTTFCLKIQPPLQNDRFDPLKFYKTVGNQKIDHAKINAVQFDWTELLSKDYGMSNLNIIHLLRHRHEFIDSDYLTEREIKRVNFIKEKFAF